MCDVAGESICSMFLLHRQLLAECHIDLIVEADPVQPMQNLHPIASPNLCTPSSSSLIRGSIDAVNSVVPPTIRQHSINESSAQTS